MSRRDYAGIGSRRAPREILELFERVARALGAQGWQLRSGAADGCDAAFERGADLAGGRKQIFLPFRGFRRHPSALHNPPKAAYEMAARFHPAWQSLTPTARSLMARNCQQVLGANLDDPVAFVVCWTPDGCRSGAERSFATGGTGQAISIASAHGVKVRNAAVEEDRLSIERFLIEREAELAAKGPRPGP